MEVVVLPPGVYKLNGRTAALNVYKPTEYRAEKRWETIITNVEGNAVNVYAPCKLVGLQICFADRFGVQRQGDGASLEMEDCWVHHCGQVGVMWRGEGKVVMRECLLEHNGSSTQHDHNAYIGECEVDIQRCIFRYGSGFSVQLFPKASGVFSHNLVVNASRALYGAGPVTYEQNTVVGKLEGDRQCLRQFGVGAASTPPQKNLVQPWSYPWGKPFLSPQRDLYLPDHDLGGQGCYRFDPDRDLDWAAKQWPPLGFMSSEDRRPFQPLFPDP